MEKFNHKYGEKTYNLAEVCAFKKTKELFGGLSNMASGFPLVVNGVHILTSEALYQACRFPHLPEVQKGIIAEKSPMSAKMKSKPYRENSRIDFEDKKVDIMRWCLRVKFAQNFISFAQLLESTENKDIVENSHKDHFWGAVPTKENESLLTGANVLGRLLKQLRKEYYESRLTNLSKLLYVEPLKINDFLLFGEPIKVVDERENFVRMLMNQLNIRITVEVPKIISKPDNTAIVDRSIVAKNQIITKNNLISKPKTSKKLKGVETIQQPALTLL
jgi:ribA/ribD-fused uncharacterized protein